jgi:enoyl-CoA hydratase/carnithine racemase
MSPHPLASHAQALTVAVEDAVALVTLNRPDRLNAYTVQMGAELFRALAALDDDPAVRAIIVTGAGRAFCAGMDLEAGGETFASDEAFAETRRLERRVRPWNMSTPVIAALNGPAVGIGATLPLQWDVRLASERARIGFVFTRRGITPEAMSTWILPRLVGLPRALELLLSGRILDASEALAHGLVARVVAHDALLSEARALALDLARNTSPLAVAATKRLVWRNLLEPDAAAAKAREDRVFFWAGKQADAREGVHAFLDKRAPAWPAPVPLPDELCEEPTAR